MPWPRVNRTGEKYGECVVLGPTDKSGSNGWLWRLRHEPCGREGVSFTATITRPDFTSFEHPCPAKAEQLALKIRSLPGVEDVRTLRHVPMTDDRIRHGGDDGYGTDADPSADGRPALLALPIWVRRQAWLWHGARIAVDLKDAEVTSTPLAIFPWVTQRPA